MRCIEQDFERGYIITGKHFPAKFWHVRDLEVVEQASLGITILFTHPKANNFQAYHQS